MRGYADAERREWLDRFRRLPSIELEATARRLLGLATAAADALAEREDAPTLLPGPGRPGLRLFPAPPTPDPRRAS